MVIGLEFFDTLVSIKYEAENSHLLEQSYQNKIKWLIYFMCYIIISIGVIIITVRKKRQETDSEEK